MTKRPAAASKISAITKRGAVFRLFYRGFASHDHIDVEDGDDLTGVAVANAFSNGRCPNCTSEFLRYLHETPKSSKASPELGAYVPINHLLCCKRCGWWQLRQEGLVYPPGRPQSPEPIRSQYAYQYHSILENVDISSNDVVCDDLRMHLRKSWGDRKFLSSRKAEELVASILRDHLKADVYHATGQTNAPDGGIDLFVCARNGEVKAAVQVKRRVERAVEGVEAVRSFVGALVINGYKEGIFVTTASRFSADAKRLQADRRLRQRRLTLELVDGQRLLEVLAVTSPPVSPSLPDIIKLQTRWSATDGSISTTEELLFHG